MFKEDFVKTFGTEKWRELQVVYHSTETPPDDESAQVAFRLLEMFDFRCFDYGDNQDIDEDAAKALLIRNRNDVLEMNMPPTSYMGLMVGAFSFLSDDPQSLESTAKRDEDG